MKFPRSARLTGPAEFRRVFARPEVTRDAWFRVLSRSNDLGHSRLGLAVSRKTCRSAVGRNRLKRVVRESFRANQERLSAAGGWDIVVLPQARAASISKAELRGSLETHWQKITARQAHSPGQEERTTD